MTDLPPIPDSWTWSCFGDVAHVASNLVDPADYQDLPHIAPNHIESWTGRLLPYVTVSADGVTSVKHYFEPGQILYSKIRPYLAKVTIANVTGLCSADMYPVTTSLDTRYLQWWMLTPFFTERASRHQARSVLPKINVNALRRLPVPVPPGEEQGRIVAALEEELSRIDEALDLLGNALDGIDRLERAIVRASLVSPNCEVPATAPKHPQVDDGELPPIPKSWRWMRLDDIAEVVGGITKDTAKQSDSSVRLVPYLRVANVQRGWLDLSEVSEIRVTEDRTQRLVLQHGDVLLNEGGDRDKLGRGWIWESQIDGCIHQNHVFRARIKDDLLHPKLLAWHVNSFGAWFERNGRQTTNLASISLTKIKQLPVPVPPIEAQETLVEHIEDQFTVVRRTAATVRRAANRAIQLRRSLLAEAFAGRLVPQDPEDEPASALLDRIRAERKAGPLHSRRSTTSL